jgi:nicotinamide mononucleotide transporter
MTMHLVELGGVITGVVSVWLTTRQRIWCWPIGLVSVVLFILVFQQAKLYGAMGLQVVYVVLMLYGWYAWLRGGPGQGELIVSRVPARVLMPLAAAGLAASLVLGLWLDRRTDEALPFPDAFTTCFSLVAQGMQTRKWIENWLLWFVIDAIYVGMNLSRDLWLTAGLYAGYLGLAALGYRDWRRSMRASEAS